MHYSSHFFILQTAIRFQTMLIVKPSHSDWQYYDRLQLERSGEPLLLTLPTSRWKHQFILGTSTLVWSLWSCSDCAYRLLFVVHQSSVLSHCYFMNFPEAAWESFPKAKAHHLPWGCKGVCCISSIEGDLAEGVCRKDEIGFFFF